jgi:hypothetical protein
MHIKGKRSIIKIIKYAYTTIILHNLCIKTPFEENWLIAEDEGDPDDGLNVVVNANVDDSQRHTGVHIYLCQLA